MKLVYFGTAEFAVPALIRMAPHVLLVVTQPDRPSGRGMRMRASPVKIAATELGLKVVAPQRCRDPEFISEMQLLSPDCLLVAAYGQILSTALLNSAKQGGINLHGSILPKYRGAAPIQRAILNGDGETGVTLMQMDKGMDTGDMIAVERTPIYPDETAADLTSRLANIAAKMTEQWMPRIAAGDYSRTPQDASQATLAPKVEKSEAELLFSRAAAEEYNRFRAFTPAPGAFIMSRFGPVKLAKARLGTGHGREGVVLSTAESCEVAFAKGSIHLLDLQPEGKKRMSGKDFANGNRLKPGESLI